MRLLPDQDVSVDPRWKKFGEWMKSKQEQISPRMSDRELARRAKLSHTFIGLLKRGLTATTPDTVLEIARALQASEQEAFAVLGMSTEGVPQEALEFASLLNGLDEPKKRILMHMTRAARQALEMDAA